MALRSDVNADVAPAQPGEFAPLRLSDDLPIRPPFVLAPMAGVTNPPYRTLCREYGAARTGAAPGRPSARSPAAGLYVAEMVHAQGLGERNAKSLHLASFAPDEPVRSIQIFGADPQAMGDAARFLVEEVGADHVDINMGCPVRKVTGRGCGSALPMRPALMRDVIRAVVEGAGGRPVTTKIRLGVDDEHLTWRDALDVSAGEGCAWIGVHARTAKQLYSGTADWSAIAEIKAAATIPVLGNGDIWECWDALRMMRKTGCDGVIIGRGCLGRPWLFAELASVFDGREPDHPPNLGEVMVLMRRHAELLVAYFGERKGLLEMRKWSAWYTKGFAGAGRVRDRLQKIATFDDLDAALRELDPDAPFPPAALRVSRGKRGGSQSSVHLPHGWAELAALEKPAAEHSAASRDSGG